MTACGRGPDFCPTYRAAQHTHSRICGPAPRFSSHLQEKTGRWQMFFFLSEHQAARARERERCQASKAVRLVIHKICRLQGGPPSGSRTAAGAQPTNMFFVLYFGRWLAGPGAQLHARRLHLAIRRRIDRPRMMNPRSKAALTAVCYDALRQQRKSMKTDARIREIDRIRSAEPPIHNKTTSILKNAKAA
jgi:hypothetical protein